MKLPYGVSRRSAAYLKKYLKKDPSPTRCRTSFRTALQEHHRLPQGREQRAARRVRSASTGAARIGLKRRASAGSASFSAGSRRPAVGVWPRRSRHRGLCDRRGGAGPRTCQQRVVLDRADGHRALSSLASKTWCSHAAAGQASIVSLASSAPWPAPAVPPPAAAEPESFDERQRWKRRSRSALRRRR